MHSIRRLVGDGCERTLLDVSLYALTLSAITRTMIDRHRWRSITITSRRVATLRSSRSSRLTFKACASHVTREKPRRKKMRDARKRCSMVEAMILVAVLICCSGLVLWLWSLVFGGEDA